MLRIRPAGHAFTDAVLADLARIRRTEAGRAVLTRIHVAGQVVTICRAPPCDPPNAWVQVEPGEITLAYDPRDWPSAAHPAAGDSDVVLLGRLAAAQDDSAPLVAAYRRQRDAPAGERAS